MSMMTPQAIAGEELVIARRMRRWETRLRVRRVLKKVAWTIPATLGIFAFVAYTETSDTVLPALSARIKKVKEYLHAWWMSTFHDDRRG